MIGAIFCSCIFVIALFCIISELFYMQSNSYNNVLYLKNYCFRLLGYLWLVLINIVILLIYYFLFVEFGYVLFSLMTILNLIYMIREHKGAKLKFTHRIIRLFIMNVVLLLILIFDMYFFSNNIEIVMMCLIFFYVPILIVLSNCILIPIENFIGRKYLRSAKNKLSLNSNMIKIGITGSYGKTSVKEILTSILSKKFYTLATPKSFNTPYGISKTILSNLHSFHEVFICEMGAKKSGEILELCNLVNVDCGIVTSVGRQHTNTFGDIDTIYKTKKELPDYLNGRLCVFNLMNVFVSRMYNDYCGEKIGVFALYKRNKLDFLSKPKIKSNCLVIKRIKSLMLCANICKVWREYCIEDNLYAKRISLNENGISFDIYYSGVYMIHINSSLVGYHNVINILLAVALAIKMGVDESNIIKGVDDIKSINARFEIKKNNYGAVIINNGYNSNLDSARYSFGNLELFKSKKKIVITPGLIDCHDPYEYNYKFGCLLANYCDQVVIVKKINNKAIVNGLVDSGFIKSDISSVDNFDDVKELINNAKSDTVILIENDLPDNFK